MRSRETSFAPSLYRVSTDTLIPVIFPALAISWNQLFQLLVPWRTPPTPLDVREGRRQMASEASCSPSTSREDLDKAAICH